MNSSKSKYIYIALIVLASIIVAYSAYSLIVHGSPTSKSVREYLINGNELHKDSLFEKAMKPYGRAYSMDTLNAISSYNNGTNILLKNYKDIQGGNPDPQAVLDGYKEAERMFGKTIENSAGKNELAMANHNLGLSFHLRDTLQAAEAAYKEALRNDPTNENTRYNLAVVQYLLKNDKQQQNQQNSQDQQQQQQDQQQNQQNQQQQNQQQQDQQQDKQEQKDQQQNQQQQQQQQQLKKENYERMLEAVMQDEKELREKMDEEKAVQGIKVDLEKNW